MTSKRLRFLCVIMTVLFSKMIWDCSLQGHGLITIILNLMMYIRQLINEFQPKYNCQRKKIKRYVILIFLICSSSMVQFDWESMKLVTCPWLGILIPSSGIIFFKYNFCSWRGAKIYTSVMKDTLNIIYTNIRMVCAHSK